MLKRRSLRRPYILETDSERCQRIAAVKALFTDIAREHLTRNEARELFNDLVKRFKPVDEETDLLVLKAYDSNPNLTKAEIARRLHKEHETRFKNVLPGSTAKRLGRLLARRKELEAATRKWREEAKRHSTKSILGDI
jgi:hypothetical protein